MKFVQEEKADFDADFAESYGVENGVLSYPANGEIYAPIAMWLEAIDLVLERLQRGGLDFTRLKAVSGAGNLKDRVMLQSYF